MPHGTVEVIDSFPSGIATFRGLEYVDGEIFAVDGGSGLVVQFAPDSGGHFGRIGEFPTPSSTPSGLTSLDGGFAIGDRNTSVILTFSDDPADQPQGFGLTDLRSAELPAAWHLSNSFLFDLTWGGDHLWMTWGPGYSSSIYKVDLAGGAVLRHRWSYGPLPVGATFDPDQGRLWTLESRGGHLGCFDEDLEWTGESFALPRSEFPKPAGLAALPGRRFWVADQETGDLTLIEPRS